MALPYPGSVEEARALLMGMGSTSPRNFETNAPLGPLPASPDAASILLQSMGQTGSAVRPAAPMAGMNSPEAVQMLLQGMGQSSMPKKTVVTPLAPMEEAMIKGVDPVGHMPPTLEATKALLRGMGLSGIDGASTDTVTALTDALTKNMGGVPEPKGQMVSAAPPAVPSVTAPTVSAPDPLAADRNGWNKTKTGKVDTEGAEQRINARAQAENTGVTATRDSKGQLVLSNVGGTGGPSVVAPSTPNTLAGAMAMLRQTQDPNVAAGIMANVRETAAAESAKIASSAQQFAANKLGIPALETYLAESEANDRRSPSWFAGIGDSPGTARIRQDLNQARAAADLEARRFLETNTSAAALRAQLSTAEAEMQRIGRITERNTTMQMNRDNQAALREERAVEKAEATLGSLTPEMASRLATLNPQLSYADDPTQAMASIYKAATGNKDRVAALTASAQQLPLLAMMGNPDATALVVAEEIKNNPSVNKDLVEMRLMKIRDRANMPGFDKQVIAEQYGDDKEGATKALGDMNMAGATDPAAKRQKREMLFAAALEMERKQMTATFAQDVSTWGITDPLFLAAQDVALKNTGKRNLAEVATAYLDGAVGAPAIAKLQIFNQFIDQSVQKQGRSLFGMPDAKALKNQAYQRVRQDPAFLNALVRGYGGDDAPMPQGTIWGGWSTDALMNESAKTIAARRTLASAKNSPNE